MQYKYTSMHRPFPSLPSSLTNTKHFMASQTLLSFLILLTFTIFLSSSPSSAHLFREYIGAEFTGVRLSDVPINPDVNFHFILAFALDYTTSSHPTPTNGHFNFFWDTGNLTPSHVAATKRKHKNVKVFLSLGGDSVGDGNAYFAPSSIDSWVENAVSSLTKIIKQYHMDGIDIDYEHFQAQPSTFADCIGRLITTLKKKGVISVASIASFDNSQVQSHYIALWRKYKNVIDYVNFQFYAYSKGTTISEFLRYFDAQRSNYKGGKILASFATDRSTGGLTPGNGFFRACRILQSQEKLHGIFIWSADDSKKNGFHHEKQAQLMLASGRRG